MDVNKTNANAVKSFLYYNGFTITSTVNSGASNSSDPLNARSQATTQTTNALGQLVTVTDSAGKTLQSRYDSLGNLSKTIDAAGNIIQITYDAYGRKIAMSDPDKGSWTYNYNGLGQQITQSTGSGNWSCMAYDKLGRRTKLLEFYGNSNLTDAANDCANPVGNTLWSTWTYDSAPNAIGKLASAQLVQTTGGHAANEFSESYSYDSLSRPVTTTHIIKGVTYATDMQYDSFNRPSIVTYPGPSGDRLAVKSVYNALGFVTQMRNASNDDLYWQANAMDARGNITQQTFGNGVQSTHYFENVTGKPTGVLSQNSSLTTVQNISLSYDHLGNLQSRADAAVGVSETFAYDNNNRLLQAQSNFGNGDIRTQAVSYDTAGLGNIKTKTGVGTYYYGAECAGLSVESNGFTAVAKGPHAVCGVVGNPSTGSGTGEKNTPYTYDANGNMLTGDNRTMTWNVISGLPTKIVQGSATTDFNYGPDHQRYLRKDTVSGAVTSTVQVGSYEKITKSASDIDERHYLGNVVINIHNRAIPATRSQTTRYLHKDHLGSTTAITDEAGSIVELQSYDAWGARRAPNQATILSLAQKATWNELTAAQQNNSAFSAMQLTSSITTKGYTGHEMLDQVGLIHMNGRVYDPQLARFISADPIIQDGGDLQSYNRYSYVRNNPLVLTDPSGFSWFSKAWKKINKISKKVTKFLYKTDLYAQTEVAILREIGRVIIKVPALQVVANVVLAVYAPWAIPIFNAAVAASVTYENGGSFNDVLKCAAIAYAASWVGGEIAGSGMGAGAKFAAGMAFSGAVSKAQGGKLFDAKSLAMSMAASAATRYVMKSMESGPQGMDEQSTGGRRGENNASAKGLKIDENMGADLVLGIDVPVGADYVVDNPSIFTIAFHGFRDGFASVNGKFMSYMDVVKAMYAAGYKEGMSVVSLQCNGADIQSNGMSGIMRLSAALGGASVTGSTDTNWQSLYVRRDVISGQYTPWTSNQRSVGGWESVGGNR
jgi:RHS repeat-associated protein